MSNMNKNELKEIVESYASKVFFFCRKRCNSLMDAEDLSQTILLELIQNIEKGAQINNIDYYIWGVCKNQYNMYLRKTIKDRNNVEYTDYIDIVDESKTPLDEMIEDEKIRLMNQAIKLLSKDYSEILYAYYVEDKTLKFIADELNMPLGTVKWKLSEIRKRLKEYLDMEKLNGKKAYVPKSFEVVQSFSGNLAFNPSEVVKNLLVKNLLYHSYGVECSIEDYSIELGIAKPYIEDFVNTLYNKDFLLKLDNGKYLTNIAFIDKKERREILDYGRNNIDGYYQQIVRFVKDNLDYYRSLLDDNKTSDEHLMWSLIFLILVTIENEFVRDFTLRKDGSHWDIMLCENMDKYYDDEFFISGNGTWETILGHRLGITAFPANYSSNDCKACEVIAYEKALTGKINVFILYDILIKNVKYSEMNSDDKEIVDQYVEKGMFSIIDNQVKINIPVISQENYKLFVKKVTDDQELVNSYKELFNGIYHKVSSLIPPYLESQSRFIVSALDSTRSLIISRAFDSGLIKDDNTYKTFIHNGIIFK